MKMQKISTNEALRDIAAKRLKAMFPNGRPRFGDKRDEFLAKHGTKDAIPNPCTSKGLSTMPRRKAA